MQSFNKEKSKKLSITTLQYAVKVSVKMSSIGRGPTVQVSYTGHNLISRK